jgi:hypothetical protein
MHSADLECNLEEEERDEDYVTTGAEAETWLHQLTPPMLQGGEGEGEGEEEKVEEE